MLHRELGKAGWQLSEHKISKIMRDYELQAKYGRRKGTNVHTQKACAEKYVAENAYWNLPEEQKTPFCVFPNPSVGPITLKINVEHQETTPCFVYDMTGRLICVKSLSLYAGYNTVTLDLSLYPGLYFLKVKDKVTKIIRQ